MLFITNEPTPFILLTVLINITKNLAVPYYTLFPANYSLTYLTTATISSPHNHSMTILFSWLKDRIIVKSVSE